MSTSLTRFFSVGAIALAGALLLFTASIVHAQTVGSDSMRACTMEAKQCSDGSWVGRTGPNCEFTACPGDADDYGTSGGSGDIATYCPNLTATIQRGARGSLVSELQKFLSGYYDIDPEELVTGFFGRITQGYVQQFQTEQGLPSYGIAGSLTRARIASICKGDRPQICPLMVWQQPLCGTGEHVERRYNPNGCEIAPVCVPDVKGETYSATPTSGGAPLTVSFSAWSSWARTTNVSVDFGDGTSADMQALAGTCVVGGGGPCNGGADLHASHTYTSTGVYTARFYNKGGCFTDSSGNTACYGQPTQNLGSVTITVGGPSVSTGPVISGVSGPTSLTVGAQGTWTVKATDSSNSSLSYSVVWGDENTFDRLLSFAGSMIAPSFVQSATFTHSYANAGTYAPRFTVKNAAGKSAETSISVQVGSVTGGRSFSASPTSGSAPLAVTFESWVGGLRPASIKYLISYGDGSTEAAADCYAPTDYCVLPGINSHTYKANGTYTAQLIKRTSNDCNAQGDTAVCAAWVSSDEILGTAVVTVGSGSTQGTLTATPISGSVPLSVGFSYAIGTDTVSANEYRLDFGDGFSAVPSIGCGTFTNWISACPRALTSSHTYNSAGTFTATLSRDFCGGNPQCAAPTQLLGSSTVTVSPATVNGGCSSGYYRTLDSRCLPVFPVSWDSGAVSGAACPTGYYATLMGTCLLDTARATPSAQPAVTCPSGSYLTVAGTCATR